MRWTTLVCSLLMLTLAITTADAAEIDIAPPAQDAFIRDLAAMISTDDQQRIHNLATALQQEQDVRLLVVTLSSMAEHGPANLRLETYARLLFDQWQLRDATNQRAILLVVSRDDQRAWIELGLGWDREMNDTAQRILDQQIVPLFREGYPSAGIVAAVEALDAMARGQRLPGPRRSLESYLLIGGLLMLAIFSIVSLVRQGSTGWAWLFWGAVLAAMGYILWQVLSPAARRSGRGFASDNADKTKDRTFKGGKADGSW